MKQERSPPSAKKRVNNKSHTHTHRRARGKALEHFCTNRSERSPRMAGQSKRGFATMSPEKQREIARRGGQAAHRKGTAHECTPEEARVAGRRGGTVVSTDRQHMSTIGEKGGQHSARRHRAAETRNRHEQWENVAQRPEQAAQGMFPQAGEQLGSAPNLLGQRQQQRVSCSSVRPSPPLHS
jgi:general stress protein YciG